MRAAVKRERRGRAVGTFAALEELGVELFPGFAAVEVLYDAQGAVRGVATGDMGIARDGTRKPGYQPGVELVARQTVFAEGCHGSLTKGLMQRFDLRRDCDPQTYGLGLKELWEVRPEQHQPGRVTHTLGWPLDRRTYGGGFVYGMKGDVWDLGFVTGLDYRDPHTDPHGLFQAWKTHPAVRKLLDGGKMIQYGAK